MANSSCNPPKTRSCPSLARDGTISKLLGGKLYETNACVDPVGGSVRSSADGLSVRGRKRTDRTGRGNPEPCGRERRRRRGSGGASGGGDCHRHPAGEGPDRHHHGRRGGRPGLRPPRPALCQRYGHRGHRADQFHVPLRRGRGQRHRTLPLDGTPMDL